MKHFKKFKRTQVAEMRPVEQIDIDVENNQNKIPEYWQSRISISQADRKNGSPKLGDMIARNPENYQDQWLVAEKYFKDNFEDFKPDTDFEKLLNEIDFYQNSEDIDYDLFDKIKGFNSMELGDKVEIFWKDREDTDKGYLFQLPNQEEDEYDLCVHINDVDNSEGMGDAPDEYHHLYYLCTLERIDKIEILK